VRSGGTLSLVNATFQGNASSRGNGGASYTHAGAGGKGKGGAIFVMPGAAASQCGSVFSGNTASDPGGVAGDDNDVWGTIAYAKKGDPNVDGTIDIVDVFFLINALFAGGPQAPSTCVGDADSDGGVGVDDVFYLINYLFAGGPPP
jgi:hypothetical protein